MPHFTLWSIFMRIMGHSESDHWPKRRRTNSKHYSSTPVISIIDAVRDTRCAQSHARTHNLFIDGDIRTINLINYLLPPALCQCNFVLVMRLYKINAVRSISSDCNELPYWSNCFVDQLRLISFCFYFFLLFLICIKVANIIDRSYGAF